MAKSKLTPEQKTAFKACRVQMEKESIGWAFCRHTGITIVSKEMPKGNFVKIAIAYCSKEDTFKKKVGLVTALDRWNNGEAIQIPIVKNSVPISIEIFADAITYGEPLLELVNN